MKSTSQAFMEAKTSLINILKLIDNTYDSTADSAIFVADTNALITNSSIELWRFEGYSNFEILILPTVLSELEQMKVNHRNPEVREKVISIVRRIKSYRERGKLSEGVVLAKGVSKLRTIAKEPSFENSLSWLDSQNNDDRIIASFVEVIKEHPRSSVILVTDDLNVQTNVSLLGYLMLRFQ
jgi:predicted ribonuclease YlaK